MSSSSTPALTSTRKRALSSSRLVHETYSEPDSGVISQLRINDSQASVPKKRYQTDRQKLDNIFELLGQYRWSLAQFVQIAEREAVWERKYCAACAAFNDFFVHEP